VNLAKHLIYFGYYTLMDLHKLTKILLDMLERRFVSSDKNDISNESESKFEKNMPIKIQPKSIVSETKMKILEILQV